MLQKSARQERINGEWLRSVEGNEQTMTRHLTRRHRANLVPFSQPYMREAFSALFISQRENNIAFTVCKIGDSFGHCIHSWCICYHFSVASSTSSPGVAARTLACVADVLGAMAGERAGLRSGPARNESWMEALEFLEVWKQWFYTKQKQWLGSNSFTQRNANYFHLYYHGWMLRLSNLARVTRRRIPCESFDQWTINNWANLQKSRHWSSENKTTLQRKIMGWNRKKMIMTKRPKFNFLPTIFPRMITIKPIKPRFDVTKETLTSSYAHAYLLLEKRLIRCLLSLILSI